MQSFPLNLIEPLKRQPENSDVLYCTPNERDTDIYLTKQKTTSTLLLLSPIPTQCKCRSYGK